MGWWLAPLRPLLIGVIAFVAMIVIAAATLPAHTIVIWDSSGKAALAAADEDFCVGLLLVGVLVVVVYLVAAAALTLTPRRHLLVPHADFWKAPARVAEMRRRYVTYLGRAIGATYVFLAVEALVTVVAQHQQLFQAWWLPVAVSVLFVIGLLLFAVWVFADGFRPPAPKPGASSRRASSNARR